MNERLKLVRRELNLNQEIFGSKLSLSRSHVASLENGSRNLTERTISDICREFNVNEEWLRIGEGEMFVQPETFSLDEYARKNNLTDLELDIVKGYIELDKNTRQTLISHFKNIFDRHSEVAATNDTNIRYEPVRYEDNYINEELDSYRLELEAEKKGTISSVSEDIKGPLAK